MSIASIPGASDSLVRLLDQELERRRRDTTRPEELRPADFGVRLFSSADFLERPGTSIVSILLYRVDIDEARRSVETPSATPGRSTTRWLGLELSYLLTAWGLRGGESATASAIPEQEMLQHCMEILQQFAIVQGPQLHPRYPWQPEDALRISLAPMNHEDLMRLWDGFDLPYQLSVPYLVRTVRLAPRESGDGLVTSRALAFGSRVAP